MNSLSSPLSLRHHSRLVLASILTLAIASISGCGGSGSGGGGAGTTLSGNTAVTVLASSTANDQLSGFNVDITGITLTSRSGKTVNLLTAPLYPEFIHLNGIVEPLATVSIPQDTYTSATVTVGSAEFSAMTFNASIDKPETSTYQDMGVASVTTNLPAPITITGTSMGLSLNLVVSQSVSFGGSNGNLPGTFSIAPTFDLTPVTIAAQPTNSANGKTTGMYGVVGSVDPNGTSFSVAGADGSSLSGPSWQVSSNGKTVFQGVSGVSQLAAGMPVDMDAAIQADGSLLATRIAVNDANTADLNIFSGPVGLVEASSPVVDMLGQEQQGYLNADAYYIGFMSFTYSESVFQTSGALANLQSLPFTASFNAANMVAGQNVSVTTHVPSIISGSPAVATITLMPQTLNGTVTAVSSAGSFTAYTVALAPYNLFPVFAVQPNQTTLLTNPGTIVVYVDGNTQKLNTNALAAGSNLRFYGLVFNDHGTLRMDCAQINDGVTE
jgi:hypothetical protein